MRSGNDRFASLKRASEASALQGQQLIQRGDYPGAEAVFKNALQSWRAGAGPKNDEARLISLLGKCYEAQRKYEQAYDLYSDALGYLTGAAYDDIYSSFLYLNERMGTFTKKNASDF